jgi:oxidoreductase
MGLRVGIIGAGWITDNVYLPFLERDARVESIRCYDPVSATLDRVTTGRPSLRAIKDLDVLLAEPLDLVVVASPNSHHPSQVIRALEAGHRVLCEKPICAEGDGFEEFSAAVRTKPGRFYASVPNRFRADVAAFRELVRRGELGVPYRLSCRWLRSRGIPGRGWYRDAASSGGGVLMDLGPHLLDVALWILGFPRMETIQAAASDHFLADSSRLAAWHGRRDDARGEAVSRVEDSATVLMTARGLAVSVDLAWASHLESDVTEIEIHGSRGYGRLSSLFGFSRERGRDCSEIVLLGGSGEERCAFEWEDSTTPYFRMVEHFVNDAASRANGCQQMASEALETMNTIHSAYRCLERVPSRSSRVTGTDWRR